MSRAVRHLGWVLGLALVVVGVVLVLTSRAGPEDFGWFAYTPLGEDPGWEIGWGDGSTAVVVSQGQLVGLAVAAVGGLVVAAYAGFAVGRRARRA